MVDLSATTLASVMSGLVIQNQCLARFLQFVSGLNGAIVKRTAVTAQTTLPASVASGRRSHRHSMVVKNARTHLLQMAMVIPPSVFAFQLHPAAQFLALATGPTTVCAMQRLPTLVATSVVEVPSPKRTSSIKMHSLEARHAQREMVSRNTWIAVSANAQLPARASGQIGQSAVQLVVEAANLEFTRSWSQPPMEAMNAHTRINTQRTALATKISVALWIAKDHGVVLTSALNSARIAVATVQLEHNRRPSLSLWRPNVVVCSALRNTVKFSSKIATNIAAHRTAKVLGVSTVSALLRVAMETKRRPTPSPIKLLSVVRNAHTRTLANTPKHAMT
jgi:hypothetical protein